ARRGPRGARAPRRPRPRHRPLRPHRQGVADAGDRPRRRPPRAGRRHRHRRGVNAAAPRGTAPVPGAGGTMLRVARLLKAHGLKGALKLELYTDDPEGRFTPGASFQLQVPTASPWHGRSLELAELRWY